GLADEPERLPFLHRERHVVHGVHARDLALHHALADREVLLDVLDVEERLGQAASECPPWIVSSRTERFGSTSSQQRSRWPGSSTRFASCGSSKHLSNACGQRGRNLQPFGELMSDGGEPSIECSRSTRGRSSRGIEPRSPHVYGCCAS